VYDFSGHKGAGVDFPASGTGERVAAVEEEKYITRKGKTAQKSSS